MLTFLCSGQAAYNRWFTATPKQTSSPSIRILTEGWIQYACWWRRWWRRWRILKNIQSSEALPSLNDHIIEACVECHHLLIPRVTHCVLYCTHTTPLLPHAIIVFNFKLLFNSCLFASFRKLVLENSKTNHFCGRFLASSLISSSSWIWCNESCWQSPFVWLRLLISIRFGYSCFVRNNAVYELYSVQVKVLFYHIFSCSTDRVSTILFYWHDWDVLIDNFKSRNKWVE